METCSKQDKTRLVSEHRFNQCTHQMNQWLHRLSLPEGVTESRNPDALMRRKEATSDQPMIAHCYSTRGRNAALYRPWTDQLTLASVQSMSIISWSDASQVNWKFFPEVQNRFKSKTNELQYFPNFMGTQSSSWGGYPKKNPSTRNHQSHEFQLAKDG